MKLSSPSHYASLGAAALIAPPGSTPSNTTATQQFPFDYEPRYNLAPDAPGIAVVQTETTDEINQLEWGLVPHWVDEWPSLR